MIQLFLISIAFQEIHTEVILFNQSYSTQLERLYFKEFIPQNFSFQNEKIILVSLYLQQIGTQNQEMSVCFRNQKYGIFNFSCIFDKNAIDFKKNIQNIRVMNQSSIPNVVIAQYNAISYNEDLYINVVSSSLFQILIQLVDINFCPEQCENQGICQFGICICQESFIGANCQFQSLNLLEVQILKDSFYYYLNINELKNQDMVLDDNISIQLNQTSKIVLQCLAINPYLKMNETEISSSFIVISSDELKNCDQHYYLLEQQYYLEINHYFLIKITYPVEVKLNQSSGNVSFDPLIIGLVIGSVLLFLFIMVAYGIYRCIKDEKVKARLDAEMQQKQQDEEKKEALKNSYMPKFRYEEAINKFPGLKSDLECEICLNPFNGDDEVRVTYCTHIFHLLCLKSWLFKHQTCPMCRQSLDVQIIQSQLTSNDNNPLNLKSFQSDLLFTPKSQNQARLFASSEIENQTGNHKPHQTQNFIDYLIKPKNAEVQNNQESPS